jgi:hypothetical protein
MPPNFKKKWLMNTDSGLYMGDGGGMGGGV